MTPTHRPIIWLFRLSFATVAVFGFLACGGRASADFTINANFTGDVGTAQPFAYSVRSLDPASMPRFAETISAAEHQFQVTNTTGAAMQTGNVLNTFSVDILQSVLSSSAYTVKTLGVDSVPNYAFHGYTYSLTAEKVTRLGQLFALHLPDLTNDNNRAAMQLSIWEIVYDENSVSNNNLTLRYGDFKADYPKDPSNTVLFDPTMTPTYVFTAQTWLAGLASPYSGPPLPTLYWLTNGTGQDQIGVIRSLDVEPNPVPAPSSLILLGSGAATFVGVFFFRRRLSPAAA